MNNVPRKPKITNAFVAFEEISGISTSSPLTAIFKRINKPPFRIIASLISSEIMDRFKIKADAQNFTEVSALFVKCNIALITPCFNKTECNDSKNENNSQLDYLLYQFRCLEEFSSNFTIIH